MKGEHGEYMPSQATIRRECLAIQETWTPEEERRRAGLRHYDRTVKVMRRLRGEVEEPIE